MNQRLADSFDLPYACSVARAPFRKYMYDRAAAIQHTLVTMNVIESRYRELAQGVTLRLPVLLAIAMPHARFPADLWAEIASLRKDAERFRTRRVELDQALARRDNAEAAKVAHALTMEREDVLAVAMETTIASSGAVVEKLANGDDASVSLGIAAVVAGGGAAISSSFAQRVLWRLRRPDLLWINNITDEANQMTEALPDVARLWKIPESRADLFATRFARMGALQDVRVPVE